MTTTLYADTLRDHFGVTIPPYATPELVTRALDRAYSAAPTDNNIGAHGLGQARILAGRSAANLTFAMSPEARAYATTTPED